MIDVVVISLRNATERRSQVQRCLYDAGIEFRFFDAVDGKSIEKETLIQAYDQTNYRHYFKRPLSLLEVGCYLSHYEVWRSICRSGVSWTVVLEDDVEVDDDILSVLHKISAMELSPSIIKFNESRFMVARKRGALTGRHVLVDPWVAPPLTVGYAINQGAAQRLVDLAIPFARPVDIDLKHWWEFGIDMLAVKPAVVRERSGVPSSIQPARSAIKSQVTGFGSGRFFNNLKYQWRFHSALLKARLVADAARNASVESGSLRGRR